MKARHIVLLAASLLAFAAAAGADTLYKLIDKNGKVTYSETPPKEFDGKVIKLDIDPNANTTDAPARSKNQNEKIIHTNPNAKKEQQLEAARERLEDAKQALQEARDNPREGDVQRIGSVKGGARPVFSPEFEKRLASLEEAVRAAQAQVDALERGR